MEKLELDQTERHIVNVPMPFTREQLEILVGFMNGWDNEPDTVAHYVDVILDEGRVDLNPSSVIGEGANIVDIFNFGFMAMLKHWHNKDVDPTICWWHPMSKSIPWKITAIEYEKVPVAITSNELVMTEAIDRSTGQIVKASDLEEKCPHNGDDLSKYEATNNEDELPF